MGPYAETEVITLILFYFRISTVIIYSQSCQDYWSIIKPEGHPEQLVHVGAREGPTPPPPAFAW